MLLKILFKGEIQSLEIYLIDKNVFLFVYTLAMGTFVLLYEIKMFNCRNSSRNKLLKN